jgi:tetratricopeptide (TPR) repeat protein
MSNSHAGSSRSDDSQLSLMGPGFDPTNLGLGLGLGLGLAEVPESEEIADPAITEADAEALRQERRFRRLLARKERLGDLSGMAACYIRLGDVFLARGDSEQAGEMYRKSLKLARAAAKAGAGIDPAELI